MQQMSLSEADRTTVRTKVMLKTSTIMMMKKLESKRIWCPKTSSVIPIELL